MSRIWLIVYGSNGGMEKAEAEKKQKKQNRKNAQISVLDNLVDASHIFPQIFFLY